jgi:hypothetical protein
MDIFKKKKLKVSDRKKFIGCHIPMDTSDYLELWCMRHRVPKSDVINSLLEEWQNEQSPVHELMRDISNQLYDVYHAIQQMPKRKKFRRTIIDSLAKKGYTDDAIQLMIERIPEDGKRDY